jgi:hypothetical protein
VGAIPPDRPVSVDACVMPLPPVNVFGMLANGTSVGAQRQVVGVSVVTCNGSDLAPGSSSVLGGFASILGAADVMHMSGINSSVMLPQFTELI